MTRYLLDSNAWIRMLRNKDPQLLQRVKTAPAGQVCLCSVVKAELLYGAHRSGDPARNIALVESLVKTHDSLPFDDVAAHWFAVIRVQLEAKGTGIGGQDYLIAAIALAQDLVLVSHNTREFSRVANLKLEDWQSP